jgi:hypothetical protein
MILLFDISPTDDPQPKKAKKAAVAKPVEAAKAVVVIARPIHRDTGLLGRLDDEVACLNQECQGYCHDVTHKHPDQWRIECCYCGTGQWVEPLDEPDVDTPEATECFTFPDGRFGGMSLDEATSQQRWPEYCKYAAKNHSDPAVRETCRKWLAENSGPC